MSTDAQSPADRVDAAYDPDAEPPASASASGPPADQADQETDVVEFDEPDRRWKGARALVPFLVPIDSVETHPRNPRRGNLPAIAESLNAVGQLRPIVLERDGVFIVAGNHTRRAAEEILAWTHIASINPRLTDEKALTFLIGDNRTSDLAEYDDTELASLLVELQENASGGLEGTGWKEDDLTALLADLEADRERLASFGPEDEPPPRLDERKGQPISEFVLTYDQGDAERFRVFVQSLAHEYGTAGVSETVYAACERAAKAL